MLKNCLAIKDNVDVTSFFKTLFKTSVWWIQNQNLKITEQVLECLPVAPDDRSKWKFLQYLKLLEMFGL